MKGNMIVLVLPAVVMIGLFLFGYLSISQTETISNEDLQDYIEVTGDETNENTLEINWQWGEYPEEGIQGEDYMELSLTDDGESLDSLIEGVDITLWQGDYIIYENTEFFLSEEGIVLPIPNEMRDDQILGPVGQVTLHFPEYVNVESELEWRYYHTWADHSITKEDGLSMENRFAEEQVQSYWSIIGNL